MKLSARFDRPGTEIDHLDDAAGKTESSEGIHRNSWNSLSWHEERAEACQTDSSGKHRALNGIVIALHEV